MGHSTRRLMMGAAGAGGDSTYVEDVFSTYLWRGDGNSGRPIINGIKLGNANSGTSVLFDDAGDYLELAHSTDLCFGSGDFTIECWAYYRGDFDSFDGLFGNWTGSGDNGYILETVGSGATTDLEFYYYNDSNTFVGPVQGGTVSSNQWNHLCVCRSGNTIRLFVNGTMHGSGTSITTGIRNGTSNFTIGGQVAGGGWWNGYITDLRVTKGQALYTSNFTPSTDPLTTTSQGATASNVKLLCCNKDTATGSTKTPGTITAHGETHIKSFGPFTGTDGEGGLVWMKSRTTGNVNVLFDTERGANQRLRSDSNLGQNNVDLLQPSFTNSGFTVGSGNEVNGSGNDYTSWTFRKQKGFFDVVTYTGTGSVINLSHNLGCIPGCVMIKKTSATDNWSVYHRGLDSENPEYWWIGLNITNGRLATSGTTWNNTKPTSTHVTIGTGDQNVNTNGATYVAYIFAGGESTAATAPSVDFNGSSYLDIADHSDFTFGTDDFTIECWYKADDLNLSNNWDYIFSSGWPVQLGHTVDGANTNSRFSFYFADSNSTSSYLVSNLHTGNGSVNAGQWYHVAVTRSGSTFRIFLNGELKNTATSSGSAPAPNINSAIGRFSPSSPYYYADGRISNFRYVKGTAVYTESFRPPTEPLTAITNTKLLCCNSSSVTGSTVTPGTITNNSATASTDSPFDDPEGYKFGENGDQGIIKTGSYTGNGSSTGPEINLGWEPQWVLIKNASSADNWYLIDSMRGIVSGADDQYFTINTNSSESDYDFGDLTPTGFQLKQDNLAHNNDGDTYIYLAIRRSDGYVGKPVEIGSDVFAVERGNSSSIEAYTSGFPVDFSLVREIGNASDWNQNSRLTQTYYLSTNTNGAQNGPYSAFSFDSNTGWLHGASAYNASWLSWMWKRHAGFTVCTWKGDGVIGRQIAHDMNKIPEMIWLKKRTGTARNWPVYHKGLNGGSSPENYVIWLNLTNAESQAVEPWNDTAPTSTHFTIHGTANEPNTNTDGEDYIAMLFASVEGVSKVGYYDGTGSAGNVQNIGFQPKFIMIKRANAVENWPTFNTILGLGAGNDPWLNIDDDASQFTGQDLLSVSSTGFTLNDGQAMMNASGGKYIYYAHA